MSLRILIKSDVARRTWTGRVGFSLRSSVVGACALLLYGPGLVYLAVAHSLPVLFVVVNVPLLLLFVYFWARTLRRALNGHIPFLLACSNTSLVVPLPTLERTLPPELNLFLEVPYADIESTRLVDLRYRLQVKHAGRVTTRLSRVPMLRLRLYEPSDGTLEAALARFDGIAGFQGLAVHQPEPAVVEVSLVNHAGKMKAIGALLAMAQPRLAPATEVLRVSHGLGDDDDAARETAARLESFGVGTVGRALPHGSLRQRLRDRQAPEGCRGADLSRETHAPDSIGAGRYAPS